MTWRHFYVEPLAVLFSLTYALLMWSCVVASLVPPFPDSDDKTDLPTAQCLRVLCRPVTVQLPERYNAYSGFHGSYRWGCNHPHTLVHHKLLGVG